MTKGGITMKNTIKALKYAFAQMNHPLVYFAFLVYLVLFVAPSFAVLYFVSDHKFNVLFFKIPMMNAFNGVFLPMLMIIKSFIGNSKYNYSLSFSKKLHTVVPVILSFTLSIAVFIIFAVLAGRNSGREFRAAVILIGSAGFSLIGITASLSGARGRDFLIPFILAFAFIGSMTDKIIEMVNVACPVGYASVIAVVIFAVSIVSSILYLNVIWNKKSRFIKTVYSNLAGKF